MPKKKAEQKPPKKYLYALGIDPGSHAGCCIVDASCMRIVQLINVKKDATMLELKALVEGLPITQDNCLWVIEDQFAKMFPRFNVRSLITQVINRSKWQNLAELLGFDCLFVQPSAWRSVTYVSFGSSKGKRKREEWKVVADTFAKQTLQEQQYTMEKLTEHAAEALGIAWYGAMKIRNDNPAIVQRKAPVKKKVDKLVVHRKSRDF